MDACAFRGLKVHPVFGFAISRGILNWVFQQEPTQLSLRSALFRTVWRRDALSPKIDRLFVGLGEYAAAHRYMEPDARSGKVVISLKG